MSIEVRVENQEAVIYIDKLGPMVTGKFKGVVRDLANMSKARMKGIIAGFSRTGKLQRSVVIEETENEFTIYPTAYYAAAVDQGVKPHDIYPVEARALVFWKPAERKYVFTKRVRHPGFEGKHYIAETADWVSRIAGQMLRKVRA